MKPYVKPAGMKDGMAVVILERIVASVPQYRVLGKAQCVGCHSWVWLGADSYFVVTTGNAAPLCMECAVAKIPDDPTLAQQIDQLDDL